VRKAALRATLRRPAFGRLAATYAVNELGDWMGLIALSVLVYDQTGSAIATAALFMGTGFVPALLAPLIATRAEQWPPRISLPTIYCGEAAAFGALALLANEISLVFVIALAAADAALGIAARSLTRAVVASILEPHDELRAGNAVLNVAFTGGAAAGPVFAGLVVAGLGAESALALNAVSFFVIAGILLSAGSLPRPEPEPGDLRDRLRAGIAYVRQTTTLRRLLLAQSGAFVFFAAVLPVEVIYVKETLGAGDAGYGLMLGCWGLGMLLGGILFARLSRASIPHLLFWSTSAIGLGYLFLAVAPTLALACAASVIGGAGNGVQWVSTINAVQELTASAMQTRVMSILESANAAMPGVGFALGGAIAALSGPRTTFFVAALGIFAIIAVAVLRLGSNWPERIATSSSNELDASNDVVLELIPGSSAIQSYSEVKP
jgi:predicted MFS family arabinose efflux permease